MSEAFQIIEQVGLQGGDMLVMIALGLLVIHAFRAAVRGPEGTVAEHPILGKSSPDPFRRSDQWTHVALATITVILMRVPTWRLGESNIDESQWIAASLTLADRFTLWGTVDPTTNGPLSLIWLNAWNLFLGEFNYHAAKLFTTVHAVVICILFFITLCSFARPPIAFAFSSAFAILLGGLRLNDYVGYNGEQPTTLLFSVAVALICRLQYNETSSRGTRWAKAVSLGVCLGLLPYVKLQSVPMGMVFGLYGLWILRHDRAWLALLGTVASVQATIFGGLYLTGWLSDFWITYIGENLFYAANHTPIPFWKRFYVFPIAWFRIIDGRIFGLACFALGGLLVAHWLRVRARRSDRSQGKSEPPTWIAVGYLAAVCYAISQPGTFFDHYYFWLFHPAMFVMASLASASLDPRRSDRFVITCSFSMILVAMICYVANQTSSDLIMQNQRTMRGKSALGQQIGMLAREETKLAIWGWRPRLHVETQLPQATAESVSFRQLASVKYQPYFLNRYASQLKQHEDVLFIDLCGAGGSYWFGDESDRHDRFSQIKMVIDEHFVPLGEYEGVRIFRTR